MEQLAKIFFKSITMLATTFTVYSMLDWLFPILEYGNTIDNLAVIYTFTGTTLGLIIAFYIVEEFAKQDDLETISYVAVIVSVLTYVPIAPSAHEYFLDRELKKQNIAPFNQAVFDKYQQKMNLLIEKRSNYTQEPIIAKANFQKKETKFKQNRVLELKNMKYKTSSFKTRAWGTSKYKQYEAVIKGFNSPKELADKEYQLKIKRFNAQIQERKESSLYISEIKNMENIVSEISPKYHKNQRAEATNSIWSTKFIMVLLFIVGFLIEMLSALPLIIKKRLEVQRDKRPKQTEQKKQMLSLPSPVNSMDYNVPKNVKELTELDVLRARYKGVSRGQYLLGRGKLPFPVDGKLNQKMTILNKKLKNGGIISGVTHHEALVGVEEAIAYAQKCI